MDYDIFEFIWSKLNLLGKNIWFVLRMFLPLFHFTTVPINLHNTVQCLHSLHVKKQRSAPFFELWERKSTRDGFLTDFEKLEITFRWTGMDILSVFLNLPTNLSVYRVACSHEILGVWHPHTIHGLGLPHPLFNSLSFPFFDGNAMPHRISIFPEHLS